MNLIDTYETLGGRTVQIHNGNIRSSELQLQDRLEWLIGRGVVQCCLVARVTDIDSESRVTLDMVMEDNFRVIQLGRHLLRNHDIQGEKSRLGGLPFPLGESFKEAIIQQGFEVDPVLNQQLKRRRTPDSPWLVREA